MHICIKSFIIIAMNVGIYYNKNHITENLENIGKIEKFFKKHNISSKIVTSVNQIEGLDILLVLGGDGTILNVAAACAMRSIKILGINYGHLGFLTEFEQEKIYDALQIICKEDYGIKKRAMLEISYREKSFCALNDFVIQRNTGGQDFSNTVSLRAEIDGAVVDNYKADGLIISTPTGSTAYSLSAGGSILAPDLDAFILTPICAHSLHSRPVVFNANSVVKILPMSNKISLNVIVDGKIVDTVAQETVFVIKKSLNFVEFVSLNEKDFFNKLLIKLNIWSK